MLEVEAKVRCPDLAAVRARLAALGATLAGEATQEDTFFRHPGRNLAAGDEALRLRRSGGALELTYKGPRQPGPGAKARVEQTVRVSDDPTPLLRSLGFVPSVAISKRRQAWRLGRTEIALDHLEGLGDFVEVEVQSDDAAAAREEVARVLGTLGLGGQPLVAEAYIDLAMKAGLGQTRE